MATDPATGRPATKEGILADLESKGTGKVVFAYFQGKDSTVGGALKGGVCLGMSYNFVTNFVGLPTEKRRPVFVKDPTKESPVPLRTDAKGTPTERAGERQAAGNVRFSHATQALTENLRKPLTEKQLTDHGIDAETAKAMVAQRDVHAEAYDQPKLEALMRRDGVRETKVDDGYMDEAGLARGRELATQVEQAVGEGGLAKERVVGIVTLGSTQTRGGHALAVDIAAPNAQNERGVKVFDPNYGLVSFRNMEGFKAGMESMWALYAPVDYDRWILNRYTAEPRTGSKPA